MSLLLSYTTKEMRFIAIKVDQSPDLTDLILLICYLSLFYFITDL